MDHDERDNLASSKRRRTLSLVVIAIMVVSNTSRAQEVPKPKIPERLIQVLDWLPPNTETLVVANGPFEIPKELTEQSPTRESVMWLSYSLLAGIQDGLLQEKLHGQKVLIAAEASRHFTSPSDLGMLPYEGCQLLQFDDAAHDALKAAVESCFERAALNTIQLQGTKWLFSK
jgi:hypothetical protein